MAQSFTADACIIEDISQPDITDKETVIALARMTADSYVKVQAWWIISLLGGMLLAILVGKVMVCEDIFGWMMTTLLSSLV